MTTYQNYFEGKNFISASEKDLLSKETVLITGGSGFIGTNLVEFYLGAGVGGVFNLDIVQPRNPLHVDAWRAVDICNVSELSQIVEAINPSVVFHLGARTDLSGSRLSDYAANTVGVANLIEVLKSLKKPPRTIFASSRLVCRLGYIPTGDDDYAPSTIYGESKIETELAVRRMMGDVIPWVIVRPTSIWGPWFGTPYKNFFDAVRRRLYLHPENRQIEKSFGFVGNTVYQLHRLMFSSFDEARSKTLYLCDYPNVEIGDWSRRIAVAMGVRPPLEVPGALLSGLAIAGDLLERGGLRNAPLTSFRLQNLVTEMIYDTEALSSLVGKLPFDLDEGVSITCDWLLRHEKE